MPFRHFPFVLFLLAVCPRDGRRIAPSLEPDINQIPDDTAFTMLSWLRNSSLRKKSKAPEPIVSGALRHWDTEPAILNPLRHKISPQRQDKDEHPGKTATAVRRVWSAVFGKPSAAFDTPARNSSSIDLQLCPANSVWLPPPTDEFWRPVKPDSLPPPYPQEFFSAPPIDIARRRTPFTLPGQSATLTTPEPSISNQHARPRHAVTSTSIELHSPSEDIYGATPPSKSTNPFYRRPVTSEAHPIFNAFPANAGSRQQQPRTHSPSGPPHHPPAPDEKDCAICIETLPLAFFPLLRVSSLCDHAPSACLVCLRTHIRTTVTSKAWRGADVVTCPECNSAMDYNEVQRHADRDIFAKYDSRILSDATARSSDYFNCPGAGCGSGQVHDARDDAPIVTCVGCRASFASRIKCRGMRP